MNKPVYLLRSVHSTETLEGEDESFCAREIAFAANVRWIKKRKWDRRRGTEIVKDGGNKGRSCGHGEEERAR